MKVFVFVLIFSLFESAFAIAENFHCPDQISIAIECQKSNRELQLISHIGNYFNPTHEIDPESKSLICSYSSDTWTSTYFFVDNISERIIRVSTLEDLSMVAQLVRQTGFPVEYFGDYTSPFTMMTYPLNDPQHAPEQLFLFSGLESTFDQNNFSIAALDAKSFSTVVINEKYLKSQDAAADTFQTGNNCSVSINNMN